MTTHTLIPLLGKMLRVTELDDCGAITPTSRQLTTDGFITVTLGNEVEDGTEIIVKKANGQFCVNEKSNPSFKRFTVEINFCGVNPSLLSIVSNAIEYADHAGDIAGFKVAEGEITGRFALELWTGTSGAACGGEGIGSLGYMLLPYISAGVIGDIEIQGEDAINFTVTGAMTVGGNSWGVGPYNVLREEAVGDTPGAPAKLPTALDPFDHFLMIDTSLAHPPHNGQPVLVSATPAT